jgi:tetratricopeptide (TPR) repeat protein
MRAWAIASSSAIAIAVAIAVAAPVARAQPSGRGEDDSAGFVEEGRRALKKRDYKKAATALDEALRINPRRLEAYVLRTAVYSAQGDHAAGVTLMKRARELAPDDVDVQTALGTQLVLAGEVKDGVPLLEQVVAKVPRRYDAQLVLGEHWHATGRWPDAIAAFEAYFASRPDDLAGEDPEHQIDLADSYLRYRQPAEALALFQKAADRRPRDLRAKIGVAWAMAATDCRKARPLLSELRANAEDVPEIWLVDGQCALATGEVKGALELGRRYLAASPKATAAGHALVGEAEAARGDLAAARTELGEARRLEPERRRWAVRLAHVLRRGGAIAESLAELETIGPPEKPELDPAWWTELGETLVAAGEAATAVDRLAPVIAAFGTDAPAQTIYGVALAKTGKTAEAIAPLETANGLASTARARQWLAYALGDVGTKALEDGDAATADARLTRAVAVEPTPALWRNLGVARLAIGGDAIGPLEKATAGGSDAAAFALLGRARAATDPAGARAAFAKAIELAKGAAKVDAAVDAAAFEVAAGEPGNAVASLDAAAAAAKGASAPVAQRYKTAGATARHAAGLAALRAGQGGKAVDHLEAAAAATGGDDHDVRCDLAVATVVAGDRDLALRRLKAVASKPCPFPAPADVQAVPILIAFVEGRTERKAARALAKLQAIDAKASGPIKSLVATAIRVIALESADDAYRRGKTAQAKKLLAEAKRVQSRAGADELAHNLAVVDIADGKLDAAIAALEKSKLPEALVNLGVAYDRKGDPRKALDAWRKARRAGAKHGPLGDWIESKEQIYGGGDE